MLMIIKGFHYTKEKKLYCDKILQQSLDSIGTSSIDVTVTDLGYPAP